MQRVAIINSRQALRPTGASAWLHATITAVETLTSESEYIFLSSLGEITYELTLNSLSKAGATVEVVVTVDQLKKYTSDEESFERYLFDEFKLPSEHLHLLTVEDYDSKKVNSQHTRDREMTIEPYAIAIPLDTADKINALEVRYHTPQKMTQLSQEEKLYAHSSGVGDTDWKKEKEWRVLGDVDLTSVWNELLILTENEIQANKIKKLFGLEALAVFKN